MGFIWRCLVLAFVCANLASGKNLSVSKEEYAKMRKYLSSINKKPVKSVKTKHGHIFDCVEIYKQPAMDHPLLQNHKIEMQPSSLLEASQSTKNISRAKFGLPKFGCPPSTIPIKRVRMEDLLRAGSLENFFAKPYAFSPHKYAVMDSGKGSYHGTELSISLWNPQVEDGSQFSLTQLWLLGLDQNNVLSTLEAGWQVYPNKYDSDKTHLFTYWTSDGYGTQKCYNLDCPGFVQVSQEIAPGSALEPVSTVGGDQYDIHLSVYKDNSSGNWWLTYGEDYHPVGYWPSALFNNLDSANEVQWGGETVSGTLATYPSMGSGILASEGYGKSAYLKGIKVIDENDQKIDASIVKYAETNGCYDLQVQDGGTNSEGESTGGYVFYGGPGGTCDT